MDGHDDGGPGVFARGLGHHRRGGDVGKGDDHVRWKLDGHVQGAQHLGQVRGRRRSLRRGICRRLPLSAGFVNLLVGRRRHRRRRVIVGRRRRRGTRRRIVSGARRTRVGGRCARGRAGGGIVGRRVRSASPEREDQRQRRDERRDHRTCVRAAHPIPLLDCVALGLEAPTPHRSVRHAPSIELPAYYAQRAKWTFFPQGEDHQRSADGPPINPAATRGRGGPPERGWW